MKHLLWQIFTVLAVVALLSCEDGRPPTAPAVKMRDSAAIMTSYGVSKLISDSGLIRYKIVTEEWRVYDRTTPSRHYFPKGLLLERFNPKFHIEMYITADTAYWYDQNLWELRGRVKVWNEDGSVYTSNLLYYDMRRHEFYSNAYAHFKTPDREVECYSFSADEKMRHYYLTNVKATFPLPDQTTDKAQEDSIRSDEKTEVPNPETVVSNLPTPRRATPKEDSNLPPGGHFK